MKVVIIDDDDGWVLLLGRYLQKVGCEVFSASNGHEGVEVALRELPDVILSDIAMPKGNGYYVIDSIRSNVITRHIPIIAVTGSNLLESEMDAMAVGFDRMVVKSLDIERTVNKILEGFI